jgi:hypothetical protein
VIAILFWNIKKGAAASFVPAACLEHDVDVAILVEDTTPPGLMEGLLNSASGSVVYKEHAVVPSAIRFYYKMSSGTIGLGRDDKRMSVRTYTPHRGEMVLLAAAHIVSKLHVDAPHQAFFAEKFRKLIEDAEGSFGHSRTIALGDFNMDPFESGMTSATGLHATMDRNVARQGQRVFDGEDWKYFYNPMWSRLGDESEGPSGTYYYAKGGLNQLLWHTFDQVLIRPQLISAYEAGSVKVLESIGSTLLVEDGKVWSGASDHLPIILKMLI